MLCGHPPLLSHPSTASQSQEPRGAHIVNAPGAQFADELYGCLYYTTPCAQPASSVFWARELRYDRSTIIFADQSRSIFHPQHQRGAKERGEYVDIHDIGGTDLGDNDLLITDISLIS